MKQKERSDVSCDKLNSMSRDARNNVKIKNESDDADGYDGIFLYNSKGGAMPNVFPGMNESGSDDEKQSRK